MMRGVLIVEHVVIWSIAIWSGLTFAQTPTPSTVSPTTIQSGLTAAPPSCTGCQFGALDSSLLTYPAVVSTTSVFLTITAIPWVTVIDGTSSTFSTEYLTELTTMTETVGNVSASFGSYTGTPTQQLTWTTHGLTL